MSKKIKKYKLQFISEKWRKQNEIGCYEPCDLCGTWADSQFCYGEDGGCCWRCFVKGDLINWNSPEMKEEYANWTSTPRKMKEFYKGKDGKLYDVFAKNNECISLRDWENKMSLTNVTIEQLEKDYKKVTPIFG